MAEVISTTANNIITYESNKVSFKPSDVKGVTSIQLRLNILDVAVHIPTDGNSVSVSGSSTGLQFQIGRMYNAIPDKSIEFDIGTDVVLTGPIVKSFQVNGQSNGEKVSVSYTVSDDTPIEWEEEKSEE